MCDGDRVMAKVLPVVPSCMCPFLFRLLTQRVSRAGDGPLRNGGPPLPRLEYTSGTDDGADPTTSDRWALMWSVVVRQTIPHQTHGDVFDDE